MIIRLYNFGHQTAVYVTTYDSYNLPTVVSMSLSLLLRLRSQSPTYTYKKMDPSPTLFTQYFSINLDCCLILLKDMRTEIGNLSLGSWSYDSTVAQNGVYKDISGCRQAGRRIQLPKKEPGLCLDLQNKIVILLF